MVLSDEGATTFLENGLGTTFQLIIDEVVSKQLFKAHTAELLPAGDYKLVVKSRAGDAAGPLQTSFRKVKYLHVVDPEPVWPEVQLVSVNNGADIIDGAAGCTIEGENLAILDGDSVTMEAEFEDTRKIVDADVLSYESSDTLIALHFDPDALSGMAGGRVNFTVRSRGGVAEAPFQEHTIDAAIGIDG